MDAYTYKSWRLASWTDWWIIIFVTYSHSFERRMYCPMSFSIECVQSVDSTAWTYSSRRFYLATNQNTYNWFPMAYVQHKSGYLGTRRSVASASLKRPVPAQGHLIPSLRGPRYLSYSPAPRPAARPAAYSVGLDSIETYLHNCYSSDNKHSASIPA